MPAFPSITYKILMDSFSIKPVRPPLRSAFDQFNVRLRAKPGYKTAEVMQNIIVPNADFATLRLWHRDDIVGGSLSFTQPVWDGAAWQSARTVQLLSEFDGKVFTPSVMVLPWNLTVYDLA